MQESTRNTSTFSGRPTFTINGQPNSRLGDHVRDLRVEESLDGRLHCEARFSNWGRTNGEIGYLYFGSDILNFGDRMQVEIGSGEAGGEVFQGSISALEGIYPAESPPEILVVAKGDLFRLRMTPRTRTFEDVNAQNIIQQIASEHGLSANIDISGPVHPLLAQVNQSDLAFIRDLLRRAGVALRIDGQTIHVFGRGDQQGELDLEFGSNLLAMRMRADLAEQRTKVGVSGWEVANKDTILAEAGAETIAGELQGGRSGSAVLEDAFGVQQEWVVKEVPLNHAEADSVAKAHYLERARRFVTGMGTAVGDARLKVGAWISLRGLGGLFDGHYYVVSTTHTFDSVDGYRTEFTVERPEIGRR